MISFGPVKTDDELRQVIDLQSINLPNSLSFEELNQEGFVTVKHDFDLLKIMNSPLPHTIGKDGDQVVAYALCMQKEIRKKIPTLYPLFEKIDKIQFNGQALSGCKYFVMGQTCIAKNYRGHGLFSKLHNAQKNLMSNHFDFAITSVAYANPRSMKAHQKVGYQIINEYADENKANWAILLWAY